MTEKHLEKCSTSLAIRKLEIQTTLRFHLTPVRMAKISCTKDSLCLQGCGAKGNTPALLVGIQTCTARAVTMETSMAVHQEVRNRSTSIDRLPSYTIPLGHTRQMLHPTTRT